MTFQITGRSGLFRAIVALGATLTFAGWGEASVAEPAPDACEVAGAAYDQALVSLPFEIVHGRVYIQAEVNGQGPFTFAVDTGASGLGRADASLTEALRLSVTGSAETGDGVTVASVDTVRLDSLDVGGLVRTDLELMTRDYSSSAPPGAEISGIVGRDFFSDGFLVIDFPSRTLTFSRAAGLSGNNEGALAYERPFRVPVSIGGVSMEANLDTGAGAALVLPQGLYEQVSAGPLEAAGRARLTNTVIETSRAIVSGPVSIGETKTRNVEARVSERFPEAMIGGHILQAYVVAIDQRSKLVAVCPGEDITRAPE